MESLQFAHPFWLFVGLICCLVLAWLQNALRHRRREALTRFAGARLLDRLTKNVSTTRRRLKNILLLVAVLFLFIALARPQYGFTWTEVKRKGIDILFALDTSKSMLAEDTKPNRLQRARLGIMDFVERLEGDRVGLLPFAGTSYLMCPLTLDYDAFTNSLATVTSDIIPKGGTNISAVITEAEQILNNDANHKILILLTDGENLEGNVVESAKRAKEKGMTIYTVGVGTPGGELIPLAGESGFVKDQTGKYVTSKLDEKTLTTIAEATGGLYVPLGNSGQGLETIYQQKLTLIPKEELMERRQKVPVERFFWPLAVALVLLLMEYLLPEQKLGRPGLLHRPRSRTAVKTTLATLLLMGSIAPRSLLASPAEDAYTAGDYLKASELYQKQLEERPDDPQINYNYGSTAYKNNLHDEAIAAFDKALRSDDLQLQAKAYYNRGNALYQKGVESRQAKPKQTVEKWQEALASYDGTLQLNPDDTQARENRALVAKELEQLKKEMEQQQENQNGDQQQNDQQDQESQEEKQQKQQNDQQQNKQQEDKPDDTSQNGQQGQDDQQQQNENPSQTEPQEDVKNQQKEKERDPGEQPQAAQPREEEPDGAAASAERAREQEDQERRAMGQMTREEAENLLNALKNEEGELNFVPRGQDSTVGRDW